MASAYARYDWIPGDWRHLLTEGESFGAKDITANTPPKLCLLVEVAELIALDVGRRTGLKPRAAVGLTQAGLTVEMLLAGSLSELISDDLLQLLELTANSEGASADEAAKAAGRFMEEVAALEGLVQEATAVLQAKVSVFLGPQGLQEPEARTAILGHLTRVHEHLSAAQKKFRPWQERAASMQQAAEQAAGLPAALAHDPDRQIVANYLGIAAGNLKKVTGRKRANDEYIAAYNAHSARVQELYRHIRAAG